jgi:hypothetical protein
MRLAAPQAARVSIIPAARPAMQRTARVGPVDDPRQRKADRIADHVVRISETAIVAMAARPQISRKCRACADEEKLQTKRASPQTAAADAPAPMVPRSPPQIMRAGPKRFRKRLGRADAQATVLDALFDNDQFRTYWNCLTACGEGGTVGFAAVLRGDVETSAAASPAAVIQRMTAEGAEEDPEGRNSSARPRPPAVVRTVGGRRRTPPRMPSSRAVHRCPQASGRISSRGSAGISRACVSTSVARRAGPRTRSTRTPSRSAITSPSRMASSVPTRPAAGVSSRTS